MHSAARYRVVALLAAVLLSTAAYSAHGDMPSTWEACDADGEKARDASKFADAQKLHAQALKLAEAFGPSDPRLLTSLRHLGGTYWSMGNYAAAEPLYKRALSIDEKAKKST